MLLAAGGINNSIVVVVLASAVAYGTPLLYAALGKLADALAKSIERVTLRWHPAYQRGANR